ncbi:MAG: hypothetical protein P8Y93_02725 [Acidobacteriota bacterium]
MALSTAAALLSGPTAPAVSAQNIGPLLVWVAVPSAIAGASLALILKRAILGRPRYREHRPPVSTFITVGVLELAIWGVLWPTLLVGRVAGAWSQRSHYVIAMLLVIGAAYLSNRIGLRGALNPEVAGNLRGTLLADLFTVLMPALSIIFGLVFFWLIATFGL